MVGNDTIEGFSSIPLRTDEENDEEVVMRDMMKKQNRKNKKSGGFQSMGLSRSVYRAIMLKGYKVPTPIQRKSIPVIMENLDVVAMARTGSGKTAAFLIPLFEKLKAHSAKTGARAVILSPTRELAIQTLKFTKELGKFCGLQAVGILGGDSMEDQFDAMHKNPDIIIATPGRLLHVLVEMELKLKTVEYVVFDEADRLFEMGFHEQLQEIISRLPDNRQTVMFSATLPKLLIEFAKAGLNNPTLIRLDVDSKLNPNLKLSFVTCRADDKISVLINVLNNVINEKDQSVVFVATKHHVEYLKEILAKAGISCTYIYSSLDQAARKINISKFQKKQCLVMLVTDVAARGIDIPLLDNVVNFNFPAKSKLFIHRVGRVARAGRKGHAYSIVSPDEFPYIIDLHLFLGRPLVLASPKNLPDSDCVVGSVPQQIIDEEGEIFQNWHSESTDLMGMQIVCQNAYKMYLKSRPPASSESIKRAKDVLNNQILQEHPLYKKFGLNFERENERKKFVDQIKSYKSKATIFEVSSSGKMAKKVKKSSAFDIMRIKRNFHGKVIESSRNKSGATEFNHELIGSSEKNEMQMSTQNEIEEAFLSNAAKIKDKSERNTSFKDEKFYLPYKAADHHTEEGLEVNNKQSKFDHEAKAAVLDLTGDDEKSMQPKSNIKWDRKRKRFINEAGIDTKRKKIKTESGAWISATYKSDRYKQWKQKQKTDAEADEDEDSDSEKNTRSLTKFKGKGRRNNSKNKQTAQRFGNKKKPPRRELKTTEEILKNRRKKEKLQSRNRNSNQHRRKSNK